MLFQYENNPHELCFGHIVLAFSFVEASDVALKAAQEMVKFSKDNGRFKSSELYAKAVEVVGNWHGGCEV